MADPGPDSSRLRRLLWESTRGSLGWSSSSRAGHTDLVDALVGFLRSREYSIGDLQHVIEVLKDQYADRHHEPAQTLQYWRELDTIFAACLEQTAAIHEAALERSHHSYCEVNGGDVIVFANEAMLQLLPCCRGQLLPAYFEDRAELVRNALRGKLEPGLHQMQILIGEKRIPVNAEFGPIDLRGSRRGGYGILVDTSAFANAERKAYDASPLGIVKLDRQQRIHFANSKAIQIFGGNETELLARDARGLFQDLTSLQLIAKEIGKRSQGEGSNYRLLFQDPVSGRISPLRITAIPEFDGQNQIVGTRGEIQQLDIERACEDVRKACERNAYGPELLEAIVSIAREMMPFDLAAFAILSTDSTRARIVYSFPDPEVLALIPDALPISPTLAKLVGSGEGLSTHLKKFASTQPAAATLRKNSTVRRLIAAGYQSLLCFPVRAASHLIAVLVLLTQDDGSLGPMHLKLLHQLGLEDALRQAVEAFEHAENKACVYELLKALSTAGTSRALTTELIAGLARSYRWQHVSFFKVDRKRRVFRLLAQSMGTEDGFLLPEGYEQPLKVGMLGLTYETQQPQILSDVSDKSSEAARRFHRINVNQPTQAELCFPVLFDGRPEWIINLEDRRSGMFPGAPGESDHRRVASHRQGIGASSQAAFPGTSVRADF